MTFLMILHRKNLKFIITIFIKNIEITFNTSKIVYREKKRHYKTTITFSRSVHVYTI